jgi:phage repressor protein C with HTH and peptisase S24 domain
MKRRELTAEERIEAERLSAAWLAYKGAHKGVTQEWLGAETGLGTQGAVGQYLRGVIPLNLEALMAFARVLEFDPGHISPRLTSRINLLTTKLASAETQEFLRSMSVRVVERDDPEFVQIPMVKLRLEAGVTGFQTEPDRLDGGTLGMRRNWLERNHFDPAKLIAVQVKGDSMEPSLYEDDIVVINTGDTKLIDGSVYAFNYEGEAVVKRLSRDAGMWWLTSDNPDQRKYHRKSVHGNECIVIGRVVRKESDRI